MKNIIITGGELFNKGAMAMTFVAVSELKKRFPDHEIYLLSEMDLQRPTEERAKYAFKFMGWYPLKFAKAQNNPVLKAACMLRNSREYKECYNLYSNCDLMVDISGYALSSSFSEQTVDRYLNHLEFADSFEIPVYLMPQSFGPFDFSGDKSNKYLDRCKKYLGKAKKIFVREQSGFDALKSLGLDNMQLADDLVLCNKKVDTTKIFAHNYQLDIPDIGQNSVAVIPNGMTTKVKDLSFIMNLYERIVSLLLTYNKKIYILSHSTQDAELCRAIKQLFSNNEHVILLSQDFSCIEYNALVQKFDYVIASRYHSIVHAYKNLIPCIALGWADKYGTLAKLFGQDKYVFDLRDNVEVDNVLNAIKQMEMEHSSESQILGEHLETVQRVNVFDEIEL